MTSAPKVTIKFITPGDKVPKPVFPRFHAVLFAHGCFWHDHDCQLFKWPSTRPEFWRLKIYRNNAGDTRNEGRLIEEGWGVGVVWECALKGKMRLPFKAVVARHAKWLRSEELRLEIRGKI